MLSPALLISLAIVSQPYGEPDRGQPGDEMIQNYLAKEALRLDAQFAEDVKSKDAWEAKREEHKQEYLYMLGLWPLPEKTPLKATVTGTLERDGYAVDKLHYQSRPGLYVTANLYRPLNGEPGKKFPAVLYVCGHANGGRNGSKTPYMAHPIWLAKHGFICLIVDTLELGEIIAPGIHHGTYNLQRWWWQSRGYTPAGVECWNGVRGIDYLISRDDVDPANLGVTGISGGGAATFWIAAADERIKCAIPVSGMADLESYVGNRVINGHCDCMFLYNTFQWPWTRIAGLIAPRPMLFMNSDHDRIFPMDANERITNRLERLYSLYGSSDKFDTVVSVGGHAYREDLRRASFAFLQYHLQGKADPITDTEIDLVDESIKPPTYPIRPEQLRVFPTDADLPKDQLNTTIDEHFVPMADVKLPKVGEFEAWKRDMIAELRRVVFRAVPQDIVAAQVVGFPQRRKNNDLLRISPVIQALLGDKSDNDGTKHHMLRSPSTDFWSEGGIETSARVTSMRNFDQEAKRIGMTIHQKDDQKSCPEWFDLYFQDGLCVSYLPRGDGRGRWTQKNPPNYIERSHALLGQTVDSGRVFDILTVARSIQENDLNNHEGKSIGTLEFLGQGNEGLIAAYAAVLDDKSARQITLIDPPTTHMSPDAPQFLNILRVCDVPDMLGLLAPRPLKIVTKEPERFSRTVEIYRAAGAEKALTIVKP